MEGAVLVLAAVGVVVALISFLSSLLSGGTRSDVPGTSRSHARIVADLGPVRHTFTNDTPWRFRFGVAFLLLGLACAAVSRFADVPRGVLLLAALLLLFGIATLLYVLMMRVDRLDLHDRGLALYQGRSGLQAAYYADVAGVGYSTVTYSTNGVEGRPVAKAVVVELHGAGRFEVGNDFVRFSAIADVIQDCCKACQASEPLAGRYVVSGSHQFEGTQEEITVEARSPQHARQVALDQYGVMAESCRRVG